MYPNLSLHICKTYSLNASFVNVFYSVVFRRHFDGDYIPETFQDTSISLCLPGLSSQKYRIAFVEYIFNLGLKIYRMLYLTEFICIAFIGRVTIGWDGSMESWLVFLLAELSFTESVG